MAVQRTINEEAFSFYKYKDTDETHIFKGRFIPTGCTATQNSICNKLNRNSDDAVRIITCLNENEARTRAAQIGRGVCGICVSNLYTTYEK
ncbi:hypothetical protein GCM10022386_07850 [Flavobacterium cheonhonense]|uniref:BFD-like [2Fe-2S]-binding domain-containing protein n=1 Tax=Flavobacterium cheonhonense TaxID=706185 RepID=A0ABP7TIP3_9FLAO|nr:hypothetical protein [Flavobacterium cheonhonense]